MITETKHNKCHQTARWSQFDNTPYAAFCSLKRQVTIGVLSFAMLTLGFANCATAQENLTAEQLQPYALEEVEVTASRLPLGELEAARPVTVLSRQDIQGSAIHSINDLLKYAVGVDVRQRGGFGVQTDISVRGGTFDQITVLLNGVNITNPSTGHFSADFPVAISDIERIEIIEGPASRVFGTSSFAGAINIVTKAAQHSGADIRLMSGQYGQFQGGASVNLSGKKVQQQLSSNWGRSDGAVDNSDFIQRKGFYQGQLQDQAIDMQWQFGVSSQDFGANTFYSAKYADQYEKTRKYMGSIKGKTKGKIVQIEPVVYWNRTKDHYILMRDNPAAYQNYHKIDVYGHALNAYFNTALGRTAIGTEVRWESILSTSLGKPVPEEHQKPVHENGLKYGKSDRRTNYSFYAEHNILLEKWTFSMGVMANKNTYLGSGVNFYPGIDISYRPDSNWKVFASWNKGMRLPTFTDLYYKSPTTAGNLDLKAEKTQAWSTGISYRSPAWEMRLEGFYHKGTDMIDWVMYDLNDIYHATNFALDNMGVEVNSTLRLNTLFPQQRFLKNIHLGYNYIHQERHDDQVFYKSSYAMQYLRHKIVADLNMQFSPRLTAKVSYRFQERMGDYIAYDDAHQSTGELIAYKPYGVVDAKVTYQAGTLQLYAEANNLFDAQVIDLGNIPQPGLWARGGLVYHINW
ncbi:MAG: TonB-dependent receptor [Bacteroidaceae bacterium]